jgi:hypothetical protein
MRVLTINTSITRAFDGGGPSGFPGVGFHELAIELADAVVDFEEFPDDCAFLGGRVV